MVSIMYVLHGPMHGINVLINLNELKNHTGACYGKNCISNGGSQAFNVPKRNIVSLHFDNPMNNFAGFNHSNLKKLVGIKHSSQSLTDM